MPHDCLFCKIFAGEIPAKELYRDAEVVAFEDIRPVAPTHVLLIGREHIPSVETLTDENIGVTSRLISVANRIAKERKLSGNGYRLVFNNGAQAGQTVYHLHLHLLGGRALGWPPG